MFQRIRRFFEKRSGVKNPSPWLTTALGGGGSTLAGISVSPTTAVTLSTYFAAIRNISEDIGKLPWILYRRLDDEGKERARDNPLFRIIGLEPNREMSSMSLRETLTAHAMGYGNGYAEIVRDSSSRVKALWPIDPTRVKVERVNKNRIEYVVRAHNGSEEIKFEPKDIFHLHGLGFDGLSGYSIASLARESIALSLAAESSGSALFGNGSRPSGVLTHPGKLSPKAKDGLADSWNKLHQGVENTALLGVLEEGLKYDVIAVPHKDAQWIELRQFQVSELARWLRIPPHKIGDLQHATFSNISEQNIEYAVDTLTPWARRWELEAQRKLLGRSSQLFTEILFDGLLRGDNETRFRAYQVAINSGWMSRNEVRVKENLNPKPGLDEFLIPLNTGPVSTVEGE